jgi:hypothetical protein
MKIPVKIYDTIFTALLCYEEEIRLRFPEQTKFAWEKKEFKNLEKQLLNIENSYKWLKKHKRKQKK